ncbi:MAG: metallophosphoesterase family protein [Candidatus Brocadiia bacterium]
MDAQPDQPTHEASGGPLAVISDVHANLDALVAVLAEIDRLGAERIICLGDIVGYGPDPVECVDLVRERCEVVLCGNHDFALIYGAQDFNPIARHSLEYHRELLMPRPDKEDGDREERWQFLKDLPYRYVEGERLFVHGSPRNPVVEYLRKIDVLLGLKDKIGENFAEVEWLCFVGHTHRGGVITPGMKFYEPEELDGVFTAELQQKAIINVGSVGQPRDRNCRASFVTVHGEGEVRWHRVKYDVESVAHKIDAIPAMDHSLAERLLKGR